MLAELRPQLADLAPMVRRAVGLDANALVRIRATPGAVSVFTTLPFKVLVSRTVTVDDDGPAIDTTTRGAELLAWLDSDGPEPAARDAEWRGALPPSIGWRRLDRVPDDVVRPLISSGARTLKEAADREGVPGAEPRAEVSDALLDAVVLTVSDDSGHTAKVTLRTISSLVRMGFVPRGSEVSVDTAGRWTRVTGVFGSAYAESGGLGLSRL